MLWEVMATATQISWLVPIGRRESDRRGLYCGTFAVCATSSPRRVRSSVDHCPEYERPGATGRSSSALVPT